MHIIRSRPVYTQLHSIKEHVVFFKLIVLNYIVHVLRYVTRRYTTVRYNMLCYVVWLCCPISYTCTNVVQVEFT